MADESTDTTTSTDQTATTTDDTATTADTTASAATADAGAADDTSVLGSATTDDGAGDKGSKEGTSPTPTPIPDDNGVPEAYELKLTTTNEAGEETNVDLDPVLVEEATPIFKDLGLNNEQANKLTQLMPKVHERLVQQQQDSFAEVRANWAKEAEADPETGGKNFEETKRLAARALDHFGAKSEVVDGKETNEFRKLLNESGLGNHPVMLKIFRNIGAAVSEDGAFVRNTSDVKPALSREERNYPNDVPKS